MSKDDDEEIEEERKEAVKSGDFERASFLRTLLINKNLTKTQ